MKEYKNLASFCQKLEEIYNFSMTECNLLDLSELDCGNFGVKDC